MYFQCLEHTHYNYTFKLWLTSLACCGLLTGLAFPACLCQPLAFQRPLNSPQLKPTGLFCIWWFYSWAKWKNQSPVPTVESRSTVLFLSPPPFLRLITLSLKSVFSIDPSNPLWETLKGALHTHLMAGGLEGSMETSPSRMQFWRGQKLDQISPCHSFTLEIQAKKQLLSVASHTEVCLLNTCNKIQYGWRDGGGL